MINTWFTSDSHFGHKNILAYEPTARPFTTVEEMNERLICNWNSVVHAKDIVYHLGDFCFGKHNIALAARLNGKKRLVIGNHDTYSSESYLGYFDKLYGVVFWERCILSHVPVHPNQLGSRWILNVHGHLHSKKIMTPVEGWHEIDIPNYPGKVIVRKPFDQVFEEDRRYFNISVEQNNLTPIHADVIRERLKELK